MTTNKMIFGFLTALLIICGGMGYSAVPGSSNLEIVSTLYEPYPAEPGSYMDLYIKVENTGTKPATEVDFEIVPKYPFSLDSGADTIKSYGTLETAQPVLLKYRLLVDKNAVTGTHQIELRYHTGTENSVWVTVPFDIYVKARDTVLSVESVYSTPSEIDAGGNAKVSINLKNKALAQIKDISVKLDMSGDTIPFAPINSTTEKRIDRLDSGKSTTITFDLISDATADPKVYKIPLVITYTDESGTSYTKNDIVGLLIASKPELEVYMEDSDFFTGGTKGTVVLSVSNTGVSQAKFVTIVLDSTDNYEIIGPDRIYIGNLDSDDFDTADFTIYTEESLNNTIISLPVTVSYKDAYNELHVIRSTQALKIYSVDELIRIGERSPASSSGSTITLIVVLVIIYLVYRWNKKRKSKD